MRTKIFAIIAFCFILSFLLGCNNFDFGLPKKKPAPKPEEEVVVVKGTVIARVNNYPLTLEDMNQEIDTYNKEVPEDKPEEKIITREAKLKYLKEQMIQRTLLYQEALNRGLDRDDDIRRTLEKTKQALLVRKLIGQESDKIEKEVTSKEIEDYYNKYKNELKDPEERQVREIVVSSEQDAKDIYILLLQGGDFATIARERSKVPTAKDGGDLGYIKKGGKIPQLDAVAFSDTIDVGKISAIFKVPAGYCIIKVEGKRGGKQKTLGELHDDIRRAIIFLKSEKRYEEIVGNLSGSAKIEVYEGELK